MQQAAEILQTPPQADDGTIKVIRLPHGGIKITSAADAGVDSTKKNNGNN